MLNAGGKRFDEGMAEHTADGGQNAYLWVFDVALNAGFPSIASAPERANLWI